jgi:nanoRNase/pAp phosphatase (c-di-AMP/oligoRNAs hydrolase)
VTRERLAQLRAAAGAGPVLILTHDNPDPDALASGKALATILQRAWNVPSRLVYSGLVDRAENRVVLKQLTPEWEHLETLPGAETYAAAAMVDTQPGAGNNRLPPEQAPAIVFDHHHPIRENMAKVRFADVRPKLGATVTLLYPYFEAAGIELDARLATAMFYGLKTDTRGLSRGTSRTDELVYLALLARIDRRQLVHIEQAGLSRDYFRAFAKGLDRARLYGQTVVAQLGAVHRPDLPAEMADLLIRLEGVRAVLCLGHHQDVLYLSMRTRPLTDDAGDLIQDIIVAPGKAGGHRSMAGGQIPLGGRDASLVAAEVEARFLRELGETAPGELLLSK